MPAQTESYRRSRERTGPRDRSPRLALPCFPSTSAAANDAKQGTHGR